MNLDRVESLEWGWGGECPTERGGNAEWKPRGVGTKEDCYIDLGMG